MDTRIQKLKATNRCFLCTNRGHVQKYCYRRDKYCCPKCKKKYCASSHNRVLTRCLLNGGSQCSFVSSDLVNSLKLPVISTRPLELQAFESPFSFTQTRRQVQFQFSSIWVNIIEFESLNKYASYLSPPTDVSRFAKNKRLKLADLDDSLSILPIEILIGTDFYWNVVNSGLPVKLSDSLTVSFILTVYNINVDASSQALDDVEFWSLESIGIQSIQGEKKHL
ncbi:uncharacterized protein NPIL_477151 [Nephila pilipes]|uniref:Uncharacterized protein n=1 Tax=Nephila pilipes TaxID=299642 RepID=A0A8X6PRI7_NEPPI|nr:uncharacterized protein NPIL_477151 [Nephila pilipes]